MALPAFDALLAQADAGTRSFTTRVFVVVLALAFLATAGTALLLVATGHAVPTVLSSVLGFFLGGSVFGAGTHTGANAATNAQAAALGALPSPMPGPSAGTGSSQ